MSAEDGPAAEVFLTRREASLGATGHRAAGLPCRRLPGRGHGAAAVPGPLLRWWRR